MPAAPIVAAGVMAASQYASSRKSSAEKDNMAAQTDLARTQTSLGNLLRGQSQKTFNMSAPAYNTGLNYYRTLVQGGPGALRQLMSSENSLTQQAYEGAKMGLDRAGVRGGVGEQAKAQLTRDRAAATAGMVPGMRYGAAEKLMSGGMGGMSTAQGFASGANAGYGNAGMTYASLGNTYDAQSARNARLWEGLGGSLGKILLPYLLNSGGGGASGAGGGSPYRYAPRTFSSGPR